MELQYIQANNLRFAYHEQGTGDRLVLCLHGFPDTPHTWHDLMPVLADAGYRVVAPFMRGYPPTEAPADGQYSVAEFAADVIALIDAFGAPKATLIGHDWGALAVYGATALAPERVEQMVVVAIPHPRALKFTPIALWKARHFISFQAKRGAINWMQRENYAAIGTIFRRWSPNWQFTDADVESVRQSLSQAGGVEGALGYYWSFSARRNDPQVRALNGSKTTVPALGIFGEVDGALAMDALERTGEAFTNDYQQVILPGVGHFLHREAPDEFNTLVQGFLK